MAPLPIISDVTRVAFHWKNPKFTRDATNVMHFIADAASVNDLFTKIAAHVSTSMWAHTESGSKIASLVATPLDGSSSSVEYITDGTAKWNGAGSASEINPQVCAVVKLTTAKRGRSFRGRVFLPWVIESVSADGKLASATVTNMQTAWLAFIQGMQTDTHSPVVASYKLADKSAVTGHLVETPTATQRRRQHR